jgi:hypothetical protein
MKNKTYLPTNYELTNSYDLKQTKLNLIIQITFIIIAGIIVLIAFLSNLEFSSENNGTVALITILSVNIYMILHELTHGVSISMLSKTKSRYKFRFPFLTTGTDAYLNKLSFITVCLAPSMLWGLILGILMFFIPQNYLLSLYIVLALNFAGSAGDYLQVVLVLKTPKDSLVKDDGTKTNIYGMKKTE